MPPEVSLPRVSRPPPLRAMHLRMTTYSVGRFTRSPSQSRPDLRQKSSSLQSMSQFCINTQVEESTSMPSVLGPLPSSLLRTTMPSAVTYFEYSTCTVQKPAFLNVRPLSVTSDEDCMSTVRTRLAS